MVSNWDKIWPKLYKFKESFRPYHFVLLFLILINIFISVSPFVAIYRWIKVFETLVIFYIFRNIHIDKKQILQSLFFSSALQLFLAISQIVNHKSIQGIWYLLGERYFTIGTPGIAKVAINGVEILRAYGTFSHPNSLAGFYLLLYGFVLFWKPFEKETLLKTMTILIVSFLILLSFSKVAIMGLLALTVWKSWRENQDCAICRIAKIIVPFSLAFVFMSATGDLESLDKRLYLTRSAIEIFFQQPIFGVGFGNYIYAQSRIVNTYSYIFIQPVHNIFLLALVELGLPLFAFTFYFLLNTIKKIWASPVKKAIILVIVFTGMFDHYWLTLQQNIVLVPVLFGLLQKDKTVVK